MSSQAEKVADTVYLVYDGDCPVCSTYVTYTRIKESVGELKILNARDGGELVAAIAAKGLDLNEGMVLVMQGQYYHGADCINRLALLSTRSGFFNKLNALVFQNALLAKLLYPVLRCGRNTLLILLGREKIPQGKSHE